MSDEMIFAEPPRNERLYTLLRRVRTGDVLIPRFQRPFVWSDEQRLLLLDSIARNLPIGSLIVWRTVSNELSCFQSIAGVPIDADPHRFKGRSKVYLLDGHQRLSTLYGTLGQGLDGVEREHGLAQGDESPGDARDEQVYFDLADQVFLFGASDDPKRSDCWVPVASFFDRYALRRFENEHLLGRDDGRALITRLGRVVDRFRDYEVPTVTLASEDESVATEAFSRVNRAGTPIDQVNMVSAAVWSGGIDLKAMIDDEIRPALAEVGWEEIDDKMILDTGKALLGLDIYRSDIKAIAAEIRDDLSVFDRVRESLLRAARFLKSCGVLGPAILPSSHQLVLLADALSRAEDPEDEALTKSLRTWFWVTSFGEVFSGINATRLRRALEVVRDVVRGEAHPGTAVSERKVKSLWRFDFRSTRSRALVLSMVAVWRPRRSDGKLMQASSKLATLGNRAAPMLVTRRDELDPEYRRGPENRIIAEPRDVRRLRHLLTHELDVCPAEIRESHGIDDHGVDAWRSEGLEGLLAERWKAIRRLERRRVEAVGLSYEGPRPGRASAEDRRLR